MVDISGFYNISSNAIRKAAESTSIQNASHSTGEFEGMLDKAIRESVIQRMHTFRMRRMSRSNGL